MTDRRREIAIRGPLLERILSLAGQDMVLIGGQALAFWASYHEVPAPVAAITKDADFLGNRVDVERLARGIGGKAIFPHERALTLLAGQVQRDLPGDDYINIDVLFKVYGEVSAEALRKRAVKVEIDGASFKMMHPIDVLQGRLENVHGLADKRDEHGLAQLTLAIAMTRKFLLHEASGEAPKRRPVTLKHIERIEQMAMSDAGRKVARRFGLHAADAIEPAAVANLRAFTSTRLPQLLRLMSAQRVAQIQAP
jgi:hypothetical protein